MPETTAGTAGDRPSAGTADGGAARRGAATVWPFAASLLVAALVLFSYAALHHPPGWLTRSVIIIVGGVPSGGHAVHLGLVLLILARGLKLRRLMALYLTAAGVLWSAAMSLLLLDQPWRLIPMAAFAV